ncbi:N-terminal phage integrase SAM-like domain-containing protein [Kibdelosporangium philippinense]|uniref:N-terminal phage integrase SAM-like domain-containing protein n=1 Tax=Kibdelosporangium philippinense TaxID=211113 RepID=A0ABS8ZW20_9PSEU|nr:N-terminal phage integrase SAM-like domain-containing protein [Kibdelosporangium philippinense]MCE7010047.1 N-terminal phage integrase SAM-like domain-containing protein [Kibdelosporangium philippinense]
MAWVEQRGPKSWRVRYWRDDSTLGSIPGFPTKTAAEAHAGTLESEQRQGTWIDPAAGKITLAEWTVDWLDALDVARTTEAQYRSLIKNHILPRWGTTPIANITGIAVAAWKKKTRAAGYATTTVSTMTKILSMLLADAADEKLIHTNPSAPTGAANATTSRNANASGPHPNKHSASPTTPPHSSVVGLGSSW